MTHQDASMTSFRETLLRKLALEYQELNGTFVETIASPPTPLEFLRLVNIARPAVIKGFDIPAHHLWTNEYLAEKMHDTLLSVAIAPDGRADAISAGGDGRLYFVEPLGEKMTMGQLLGRLKAKNLNEASYLQSQNGNLYRFNPNNDNDEETVFTSLHNDVPRDIPWVSDALGRSPDAVNIWIGDDKSVTSIHSDPYENIYTVVRGSKQFILFPPTEGWCLKEKMYPHATYTRESDDSFHVTPSSLDPVRWSSVQDPSDAMSLPSEARPMHVDLHAGDTLYLPAGWWHYVKQRGITVAINWWYDLEPRGMNWVWLNFLRGETDGIVEGNN